MGIAVSASSLMYITGQKHDLEYQIDLIYTTRNNIMASINELIPNGADMDPESPEVKILEQRKQRLMLIDKKLEQDLKQAQARLDMINVEEQKLQQNLKEQTQRI